MSWIIGKTLTPRVIYYDFEWCCAYLNINAIPKWFFICFPLPIAIVVILQTFAVAADLAWLQHFKLVWISRTLYFLFCSTFFELLWICCHTCGCFASHTMSSCFFYYWWISCNTVIFHNIWFWRKMYEIYILLYSSKIQHNNTSAALEWITVLFWEWNMRF